MNVAVLQILFDQYTLFTGIPLQISRYKTIVTMHVAVLHLLFQQYKLCIGITFNSDDIQLLSQCMWHYFSYSSINTNYVSVFPFSSHDIN